MRKALITGGAGFIGSHLIDRLLANGWDVTALDNFDPFYDRRTKLSNLRKSDGNPFFHFFELDLRDIDSLRSVDGEYEVIVHLAAKAGVRPSILDPAAYQEVNVHGTQNMLELAKQWNVRHFVFASSSSVYGVNPNVPWSEADHGLLPISPYASTKVSGELLGHVYSYLYGIRFIGLRFFTVFGPRQRPDLAIHKFARLLLSGARLPVFGDGSTSRDYTYIDDILDGVIAAMNYRESIYEIINLGNCQTVSLLEMIETLAAAINVTPVFELLPEQPGDVPTTCADISKAAKLLGYHPKASFKKGIERFVSWLQQTDYEQDLEVRQTHSHRLAQ